MASLSVYLLLPLYLLPSLSFVVCLRYSIRPHARPVFLRVSLVTQAAGEGGGGSLSVSLADTLCSPRALHTEIATQTSLYCLLLKLLRLSHRFAWIYCGSRRCVCARCARLCNYCCGKVRAYFIILINAVLFFIIIELFVV